MGSGLLPAGSLQLVTARPATCSTASSERRRHLPGSADTALKLRGTGTCSHARSVHAEADSLNAAVLGPDVTPDDEEFDLFAKEVAREMTVKAGQKCTAIRRAIVPRRTSTASGAAA